MSDPAPASPTSVEISVVSPVFGAADLVAELCDRLHEHLRTITEDYEIILVFDCSPDDGWERITDECAKDDRVIGVKLSRNFGQHEAITAGLSRSRGTWTVVMDCDLQDQPKEIPGLHAKALEGFDVVVGRRVDRNDGFFKAFTARIFHRMFRLISGIKTDATVASYGIYNRKVVRAVLAMSEPFRSFPLLVLWLGFDRAEIAIDHSARPRGKSSYTLRKMAVLAFNIILSFSNRPLYLSIGLGFLITLATVGAGITYFALALQGAFAVSGFATTVLSIWFLSGVIITLLGVIGLYLAKTFEIAKGRPLYVIAEVVSGREGLGDAPELSAEDAAREPPTSP